MAAAIARDHLGLSRSVIIDAVNDDAWCHALWMDLARQTNTRLLPVRVICSDTALHRHRVQSRLPDLPGHALPDWETIQTRPIQPWPVEALFIDSAHQSPQASTDLIKAGLVSNF